MQRFKLLFIALLYINNVHAQFNINFPYERTVFQRNNQNIGKVHVTGTFEGTLNRVEGRLVPIIEGQGVLTDWQVIDSSVEFGTFSGFVVGNGGWYSLQIRGIQDEQVVFASDISRVGIGEVFIVSGQSNAEGFARYNPNGATDDRVNSLDYQAINHIEDLPYWGNFSKMSKTTKTAPRGDSPWAWGELGDIIVKKLNVPVLFFNTAYEGTTIENWYSSANGIQTKHDFYGFIFPYGTPYSYLRITLQNYIARLGVRAVLWQQGESDASAKTSETVYYNSLKSVVEKSRSDFGSQVPWVVAYATDPWVPYTPVRNAQNRIVQTLPEMFSGPDTDTIPRPDRNDIHFSNVGDQTSITQLANAWGNALTTDFFTNSTPILANPVVKIEPKCTASNTTQLSVENGFTSFWWNGTSSTQTINTEVWKTYQAIVRNATGLYGYSEVYLPSKFFPTTVPSVNALSLTTICPGKTVQLKATPSNVIWNTNETTEVINVGKAGLFYASLKNSIGCIGEKSNIVATELLSTPPKPTITLSNNNKVACDGQEFILTVANAERYQELVWNTGATTSSISYSALGEKSFSVKGVENTFGCETPTSDVVTLKIVENPQRPLIEKYGPLSIQAVNLDSGTALEWYKDGTLLSNFTSQIITIRESGNYTVRAKDTYSFDNQSVNCYSLASDVYNFDKEQLEYSIYFYPNPIVSKVLYVSSVDILSDVNITVYNMKGQRVTSVLLKKIDDPIAVSLQGIPAGLYKLHISYSGYTRTETIIIE